MHHGLTLVGTLRWLREKQPLVIDRTVFHGDYRIRNMLCEDDEVAAVLD